MMSSKRVEITDGNIVLSCEVLGSGTQNLIAFHGYGQSGKVFKCLSEKLPDVTIYALDMVFHGNSKFVGDPQIISPQQLKGLLDQLLDKESISTFSMAGFSIGAKIMLVLYPFYQERINSLTLFAPDGIRSNFWYNLSTGTIPGKVMLKYLIKRPWPFYQVLKVFELFSLMDKKVLRFVRNEMSNEAKRQRVYNVWIYFKGLKVNVGYLSDLLNKRKTNVKIVMGKHDRIITLKHLRPLLKNLRQYDLTELPCNHTMVVEEYTKKL